MSEKPVEKHGDVFVEMVIREVCYYVADWKWLFKFISDSLNAYKLNE